MLVVQSSRDVSQAFTWVIVILNVNITVAPIPHY